MWGKAGKGKGTVDPTVLPILVHTVQSNDAFVLAQKVWETNVRTTRIDAPNRKELQHFVFANPACVVWLQRDQGRSDCFEMILMWDGEDKDISEVYILAKQTSHPVGDDVRAKSLLGAMLAAPATVPITGR